MEPIDVRDEVISRRVPGKRALAKSFGLNRQPLYFGQRTAIVKDLAVKDVAVKDVAL
jgi:hypothetical protein